MPTIKEAVLALTVADDPERVLAEFNTKYMVVNEAGRAAIYSPAYDVVLKRHYYERHTEGDLHTFHANRVVKVVTEDKSGNKITSKIPAVTFWMQHALRRQYLGGVVFDPSGTVRPDILNLWQGFAYQPKQGDWGLLKKHVRAIVCSGNQAIFDYLMGWMAYCVQHPERQGEVALVMRGDEGTGKGMLGRTMAALFGQHGVHISNQKHLVGTFNNHLRDCCLLFCDEAFFAGDKQHIGTLKRLITEPTLTIEAKYKNAIEVPNLLHLIVASNEDWVIPASLSARRFFALNVPSDRKDDHAYFNAILSQLKDGGYEAMLYELLHHDISGFNIRAIPQTEGLQDQKKLSLPTFESWWLDVLQRGYVWESKYGHARFYEWRQVESTELLYGSYMVFAKQRGDRHPLAREKFGEKMGDSQRGFVKARPRKLYRPIIGETAGSVIVSPNRLPGYHLGSLSLARAAFCHVTGLAIEWSDCDDDDAAGIEDWQADVAAPANDNPDVNEFTYEAES